MSQDITKVIAEKKGVKIKQTKGHNES